MILGRLREATDDPDHLAEAMVFFNAWIFAWIETIERQLTDVYMAEREQWVRGAAAVRAAEVRAILKGAPVDAAAVSQRLGYDLDRFHVGFVVWSERRRGHAGRRAGACSGRWSRWRRGSPRVPASAQRLTVAQGRHLACWAGRREPQHLGDLRVPRGAGKGALSVAAGTPAPRRPRASSSATSRRCSPARSPSCAASDTARAPPIQRSPPEALMVDDTEAARRFAERELGPLTARDDCTLRLAATLAVFLEEGASFVRAARRLGVHTNTAHLPRAQGRGGYWATRSPSAS